MAWIVFWESVSGGYRVRNNHGELVAEISNAPEGAERHAAALEEIEQLKFENADLERTYNAAAEKLVEADNQLAEFHDRVGNAEAGRVETERQLAISREESRALEQQIRNLAESLDAAQGRIAELEEQAEEQGHNSPG